MPELPDNTAWEIFNVAIQTKNIANMVGDEIRTSLQWAQGKLAKTYCKRKTIMTPGQTIYNECPYSYTKLVTIAYDRKGAMDGNFGLCEVIISGEKIRFALSIEDDLGSGEGTTHYVEENQSLRLRCAIKSVTLGSKEGQQALYIHPALLAYRWRIQYTGAQGVSKPSSRNSTIQYLRIFTKTPFLNLHSWKRDYGPNVSCLGYTVFYPSIRMVALEAWTTVVVLYGPEVILAPYFVAYKGKGKSITITPIISSWPNTSLKISWRRPGAVAEKFEPKNADLIVKNLEDSDTGPYVLIIIRQSTTNNTALSWEQPVIRTFVTNLFVTAVPHKVLGWYITENKWFLTDKYALQIPLLGKNSDFLFLCLMQTSSKQNVLIPYHLISYTASIENEIESIEHDKAYILNCEIATKSYVKVKIKSIKWYFNGTLIRGANELKHRIAHFDCNSNFGLYACHVNFVLILGLFEEELQSQATYRIPMGKCIKGAKLITKELENKLGLLYARITLALSLTILIVSITHFFYARHYKSKQIPIKRYSPDALYSAYYEDENFENVEFAKITQDKNPLEYDYSMKDIMPLR